MPGHGAVSTGEFDFGASKEREEIELEHMRAPEEGREEKQENRNTT